MLTNEKIVKEKFNEVMNKSQDELEAMQKSYEDQLSNAHDEMGKENDWDKATSLKGASADAKFEEYKRINSELGGVVDAINMHAKLEANREAIENGSYHELKERNKMAVNGAPQEAPELSFASIVKQYEEAKGHSLSEGMLKNAEGVTLNVGSEDGNEIFNALFTTTSASPHRPRKEGVVPLGENRNPLMAILPKYSTNDVGYEYLKYKTHTPLTSAQLKKGEGVEQDATPTYDFEPVVVNLEERVALMGVTKRAMRRSPELVRRIEGRLIRDLEDAMERDATADLTGTTGVLEENVGHATNVLDDSVKIAQIIQMAASLKVRKVGKFPANAIVLSPEAHFKLATETITANALQQILGGDGSSEFSSRFMGKPVFVSDYLTNGTANAITGIVGAFQDGLIEYAMSSNIRIYRTDSHDVNFAKRIDNVMAVIDSALAVGKPNSFCNLKLATR